jgi:hypothetical protein
MNQIRISQESEGFAQVFLIHGSPCGNLTLRVDRAMGGG